ncbi:MAG TPA: hypothetical protein VGN42_26145 [Pirellulales bacterium]|nr:hypothetical protein [Pirellulales bacterium]
MANIRQAAIAAASGRRKRRNRTIGNETAGRSPTSIRCSIRWRSLADSCPGGSLANADVINSIERRISATAERATSEAANSRSTAVRSASSSSPSA